MNRIESWEAKVVFLLSTVSELLLQWLFYSQMSLSFVFCRRKMYTILFAVFKFSNIVCIDSNIYIHRCTYVAG